MAPWIVMAWIGCFGGSPDPVEDAAVRSETVVTYPATTIFTPPRSRPRAAIVLLHGSEGGRAPYTPDLARELADRGYLTAAFCWFDCGSATVPDKLQRVPLDRTLDFLRWFRKEPAEDLPVVLLGMSRGAEHAVLLGSLVAHATLFEAIAAHGATDTVVAAWDRSRNAPIDGDDGWDAAWTWRGEPQYGERALPYGSGPPIALETYPGPVWLSHGEEDGSWPAVRSQRLAQHREERGLPTEVHLWAGQGQVVQSGVYETTFLRSLTRFIDDEVVKR